MKLIIVRDKHYGAAMNALAPIRTIRRRQAAAAVGALTLAAALGACSASLSAADTTPTTEDHEEPVAGASEAAARTPRLALTYEGGLLVLDATTLEVEADLALPGFNRINAAGDGRYVLVSTEGGWAVLDAGTWTQGHGDHDHYYTAGPALHDVLVEAATPGHVVVHDGLTALFDDGTGDVTVVPTKDWTKAVEDGEVTPARTYTTPASHHGVAIADAGGRLLVTEGTEEARTGARLLDGSDAVVAESAACPGVHGETVAGEAWVVGCEDGILALHEDHFHKIAAPDAFGRIGNAFGAAESSLVLGDYRTDPEGGIGLAQVSLVDVEAETVRIVDVGAPYTWRGLARGEDGEALVLAADGNLRVLDPATGERVRTIAVTAAWEVPEAWQAAHPALTVLGGMAYVTEPATSTVHVVDYVEGEVWKSVEVPHAPIELVGVTG